MAGIYIHIPYCRKACHYCNFHFSTTRYNAREMIDSLLKEAVQQKNYFSHNNVDSSGSSTSEQPVANTRISTIYFGGGTPSILPAAWIKELIDCIKAHYPVSFDAEITLEANPDDITEALLEDWRAAGITRLSIGVQSFIEEDLQWMNRAHNAQEAYQAIELAQRAGIHDISLDLIYGTPYLTNKLWLDNLQKATDLGVPHVSAYALTVEPRTALFKLIEKGKIPPVDAAKQSRHFDLLMDWAAKNNFEHYEISNLAKPGHRSRHNSSYWLGRPYLGLGPAAHSYDGHHTRKWNIDNNPLYIKGMEEHSSIATEEILSLDNQLNEMIMIELRLIEGIDLKSFVARFGAAARATLLNKAATAIHEGQLELNQEHLILTRQGKHFADSIAVDLFV